MDVIAGLLYVPLSMSGKDFIALLRKGQANVVNWAGRPPQSDASGNAKSLEPRKSFKVCRLCIPSHSHPNNFFRDTQNSRLADAARGRMDSLRLLPSWPWSMAR